MGYSGALYGDDGNRAISENEAYTVVDLKLGVLHEVGRVFLGIDNIFDVQYNGSIVPNAFGNRFFEPAPGRTVYVGISLTLENESR